MVWMSVYSQNSYVKILTPAKTETLRLTCEDPQMHTFCAWHRGAQLRGGGPEMQFILCFPSCGA